MTKRAQNRRPAKTEAPAAANAPQMRQDDYTSAVLGMRAMMPGAFSGLNTLAPLIRYSSGGLYARVVDMPADKATDRGCMVEGDADGEIAAEFDRLNVLPIMADALRWAALTGGAGIVMLTEDGGELRDELSETGLSKIIELRCFPGSDFAPEPERYEDATKANFGYPIRYRVTSNGVSFVVHESRILTVSGGPMPRAANTTSVPWMGRAEMARVYKAICRYEESLDYTSNILQRKQQGVYGMKGMGDLLKNPALGGDSRAGERIVQARIGAVDAVRGVLNTVAIDADDSYTIIDNNLGGIKDTVGEMKVAVSSEAGIPVTLLFEESPGGMNATGDADFAGWHEKVQGQQKRLKKAMERLVSLIMLQDDVTALENWSVEWPPLEAPNEVEQADVENKRATTRKTEMEALSTAVNSGILTEEQAAEEAARLGVYQINGLNPDTGSRGAAVDYAQQT